MLRGGILCQCETGKNQIDELSRKCSARDDWDVLAFNALVCTIRDGTRSVCTISSSTSSVGSLDDTANRQSPPAKGWILILAKGASPMPKGIGSAEPIGSMCTTILVFVCSGTSSITGIISLRPFIPFSAPARRLFAGTRYNMFAHRLSFPS